jgi:hypothetical protein
MRVARHVGEYSRLLIPEKRNVSHRLGTTGTIGNRGTVPRRDSSIPAVEGGNKHGESG